MLLLVTLKIPVNAELWWIGGLISTIKLTFFADSLVDINCTYICMLLWQQDICQILANL